MMLPFRMGALPKPRGPTLNPLALATLNLLAWTHSKNRLSTPCIFTSHLLEVILKVYLQAHVAH